MLKQRLLRSLTTAAVTATVVAGAIFAQPGLTLASASAEYTAPGQAGIPQVPSTMRLIHGAEIVYVPVKKEANGATWHRAMLDMKVVASNLGMNAPAYDPVDGTITFTLSGGRQVFMKVGVPGAWLDGKITSFDAAPTVGRYPNGEERVFVPIRLIGELAGYAVLWSQEGDVLMYR